MTTGESLLIIVTLVGVCFGFYKIHQKKKWKPVGKIILIIIAIILLISSGFYVYDRYKNRPQEINSLGDVSIGMKKVDITIKKGKPNSEYVSEDGISTLFYEDYSGTLKMFLSLDSKNEVYRICSFEYYDEVFGLGKYDSYEQVTKKLGEPKEKSINEDGTMMMITYPQYNVAFQIHKDDVDMTCVTTQERMSYAEEYTSN